MIYGYVRVSTNKQIVDSQHYDIEEFCKQNNLSIDGWIEETISGERDYAERKLGNLIGKLQKDDILICADLSRLGRDMLMIMEILSILMKREINLWTVKEQYRLGSDITSKVLAFAFSLAAEIQRNLISMNTKAGLKSAREKGKFGGRRPGLNEKGMNQAKLAASMFRENLKDEKYTVREMCKIVGISRTTFYKYIKLEGIILENY